MLKFQIGLKGKDFGKRREEFVTREEKKAILQGKRKVERERKNRQGKVLVVISDMHA